MSETKVMELHIELTDNEYFDLVRLLNIIRTAYLHSNKRAVIDIENNDYQRSVVDIMAKLRTSRRVHVGETK